MRITAATLLIENRRIAGLTPIPFSVAVLHGKKPGPVLALVAGSHGTEYTSIIALEKLIATLNPLEISGTAIIVPLINIHSLEQRVRTLIRSIRA